MNGDFLNVNRADAFAVQRVAPHAEQFYKIYPRRLIDNTLHFKPTGYNDSVGIRDYSRIGSSSTIFAGDENNFLGETQFNKSNLPMKSQKKTIEKVYTADDVEKEIMEDKPTGNINEVSVKRGSDFNPTKQTEINNAEMNNMVDREEINKTDLPAYTGIGATPQ